MQLYVTGGRQRGSLFKRDMEWYAYERALILKLDPETGKSEVCVDYETPPEARAGERASVLFKAGTLRGSTLYICTSTEVLVYEVPEFKRVGYVSLPCFNDLHHVSVTRAGNLLVASTGLDMVVEFNLQGEVLRQWNVLGGDAWGRFSPNVDYRKVATTKPHQSHPNFAVEIGEDVWVTRGQQRDAICLTHPGQRIDISIQFPHDGLVHGDTTYFTTVDGHVVIVNRGTLQTEEVVDLNSIDNESQTLLGWCRGLMRVDSRRFWVGFTRVRDTKFKENVRWVKNAFQEAKKPTHIALYDFEARRVLKEINLDNLGMHIVYSILPAVES